MLGNVTRICRNQIVQPTPSTLWTRNASLTSAISHGLRQAGRALKDAEKKRQKLGTLFDHESTDRDQNDRSREIISRIVQGRKEERARLNHLAAGSEDHQVQQRPFEFERRDRANARARSQGMQVTAPQAVPYTNAASEFLYGTYAVLAALSAGKRKFYNLYIWCGEDGTLVDGDDSTTEIVRLAKRVGVPLLRVAGNWDKMLDRMSAKRPHNGLVLEAGPLPKIAARALAKVDAVGQPASAVLTRMSAEERESLGVTPETAHVTIQNQGGADRYPFLLWLDKVTDTGNLGAIIRSARFLGVDGIIVPSHGTAPIAGVVLKTSAGAAERVPVIVIDKELEFMKASQDNGWQFFAAVAADSKSTVESRKHRPGPVDDISRTRGVLSPDTVLQSHPTVVVLGNEGEGLRPFLQRQANHNVSIRAARSNTEVDSLNVSVAAALLAQRFLAQTTLAT